MLTRGYERFSVLLDPICSTRFLEHVKLADFALSNASANFLRIYVGVESHDVVRH